MNIKFIINFNYLPFETIIPSYHLNFTLLYIKYFLGLNFSQKIRKKIIFFLLNNWIIRKYERQITNER